MKYYKLTNSSNTKEVGAYPQCENIKYLGDIQKSIIPWQGIIDFDFKLPEPNLVKKAKQTSLVNVVAIPALFLIIDDILLKFLKKFNLGNYQSWKINTWQNKQLIEKYNLFLINDTKQAEYIDFEKSEFYSKKLGDWNNSSVQKPIFVKDYDEYASQKELFRKDRLMLLHKKVTIDLSNVIEDMFRIVNAPEGGYYVSEKLKKAILEEGYTGMSFKEIDESKKIEVIY